MHAPCASAGSARVGGNGRELEPAVNRRGHGAATRETPVSVVTTPGAVARRGGHVGSSYRVAASRPPPGWTRARSTRVSRVPSAVVEARAPRSRRVPRGERGVRLENMKTPKKNA